MEPEELASVTYNDTLDIGWKLISDDGWEAYFTDELVACCNIQE